MQKKVDIFYSVLRYIPSVIRMESINVGLAVHVPSERYSHLFITSNKKRIAAFDDEYDKDFFNMVTESLSYDINYDEKSLCFEQLELIEKDYFLNTVTEYLSNEFQFSPVNVIRSSSEEAKRDIEALKDNFLYYDKPKGKRITKNQVKRLLSKQLHQYGEVKKNPEIRGVFGEKGIYDYQIVNEGILVKAISFDYKRTAPLISTLKNILYDLEHLECSGISKVVLVYNDSVNETCENKQNESVRNIFENELGKVRNKGLHSSVELIPLEELSSALR